ncbi:hypothetical protein DM992_28965 [Burkholderia sp. JP2-270]|nr:hypothetical protein DM992_28965 [Burkholderia sp. JP2-270]
MQDIIQYRRRCPTNRIHKNVPTQTSAVISTHHTCRKRTGNINRVDLAILVVLRSHINPCTNRSRPNRRSQRSRTQRSTRTKYWRSRQCRDWTAYCDTRRTRCCAKRELCVQVLVCLVPTCRTRNRLTVRYVHTHTIRIVLRIHFHVRLLLRRRVEHVTGAATAVSRQHAMRLTQEVMRALIPCT